MRAGWRVQRDSIEGRHDYGFASSTSHTAKVSVTVSLRCILTLGSYTIVSTRPNAYPGSRR